MALGKTSGHWNERKRALIVESDLNRLVLQLEVQNLRAAAERLDHAVDTVRQLSPWLLPALSLVAGIFKGRRRSQQSTVNRASGFRAVLHLLPTLLGIWSQKDAQH